MTAGAHVLGARITDKRGGVLEPRITTFVYEPADTFPEKFFVRRFVTSAVVGAPTDLVVNVEPYSYSYKVDRDADGDGDFDDGTHTSPGGDEPELEPGAQHVHLHRRPRLRPARARVSHRPATRIFSSRIYVGTQPVDRTPLLWLRTGNATSYGVPFRFFASLTWLNSSAPDAALSWTSTGTASSTIRRLPRHGLLVGLQGAGDDRAQGHRSPDGVSSVLTAQVQPPGLDATPAVTLNRRGERRRSWSTTRRVRAAGGCVGHERRRRL